MSQGTQTFTFFSLFGCEKWKVGNPTGGMHCNLLNLALTFLWSPWSCHYEFPYYTNTRRFFIWQFHKSINSLNLIIRRKKNKLLINLILNHWLKRSGSYLCFYCLSSKAKKWDLILFYTTEYRHSHAKSRSLEPLPKYSFRLSHLSGNPRVLDGRLYLYYSRHIFCMTPNNIDFFVR